MVMNALRKGAAGGIMKFIIFGFLIFAVGGMVMMDVGGFFRSGGAGSNDVAKIGSEKISLPSFDRNLQRALSQLGISAQDAYQAGFVEQILGSEIRTRLMSEAADDMGIMVDRKRVAKQLSKLLAPMVKPGEDPKSVLQQVLTSQGLSEAELIGAMARETSMNLLSATLQGGFSEISDSLARDLYMFETETRDIAYVAFPESEVKPSLEPTDEQLKTLYESQKEIIYVHPEMRVLKLVRLNTDKLKQSIALDDQEIKDAYENSIDLYTEKEQRTLDQALFSKEEDANAVAEKVKSGMSLKQAVKDVTKRDTDYIGEKAFESQSMPEELKEAALAVEKEGQSIDPVKTAIGWQVAVVKKITPPHTKPFDEVKKEIREEILSTKLTDQVYQLAGTVEDMLAGGATLDDVKKEVDIDIIPLPQINAFGQGKDGKNALADFEKEKTLILESGFTLQQDETSPMSEMTDGGFSAIHVVSIQPKTYTPFEDVKGEMMKRWMADQTRVENKLQAVTALDEIKAGAITPEDFSKKRKKPLQSQKTISRKGKPQAPMNERSWANIFEAAPNEPFILDIDGGTSIAWVTHVGLPEKIDTSSKEFMDFKASLLAATKNEALTAYAESKREKYGVSVNKRLMEQTYGRDNEAE